MILILDASVIIAFYSEICESQLLHELTAYGIHLFAPNAVVKEIRKGRKHTCSILNKAIKDGKITVFTDFSPLEVSAFKRRFPNLDDGEIQVLILGEKMKKRGSEYTCVIDEGPATKIAIQRKIARTGTIGLLDVLNDLGIIDENKKENLLNVLKHSKFRMKNLL